MDNKTIVAKLLEAYADNQSGGTVYLIDKPDKGFIVGHSAFGIRLGKSIGPTRRMLTDWIGTVSACGFDAIGYWKDDDGLLYFDASIVCTDLPTALARARYHQEKAIYDIENDCCIDC